MNLNCFSLSFLLGDEQPGGWGCTLQISPAGGDIYTRNKPAGCCHVGVCKLTSTLPACAILITVTVNLPIPPTCGDTERQTHAAGTERSQWVQEVKVFIAGSREGIPERISAARSISCLFIKGQSAVESGHSIHETLKKQLEGCSPSWGWFKAVVFSLPSELER